MKNKKPAAIIALICLIFTFFPLISFADAWDGASKKEPQKNSDGAYVITSPEELAWLADDANFSGSNKNAVLTTDINLNGNEWTPIGKSNYAIYSGCFDGQGHTINGLKITNSAYAGLFGYVSGKVSDVTVKGEITYIGYSTPYAGGIAGYNKGTIENCISDTSISGKPTSGGIAGTNEGNISNCINKGNISGSSNNAGGIAGNSNGGEIILSANYGAVTSTGYSYTGGIAGHIQGDTKIENVYNMGNISGRYTGGIAGYVYSQSASITNAYSAGIINCSGSYAGGIAASLGYGVSASKITNCYFLKNYTVNNQIFAVKSENNDRNDLCGKTENELKSTEIISSLGGAFEADKAENPTNSGYPILKWQNPNTSYKAVISVSPADAYVTLKNNENNTISGTSENGVHTFYNLAKGNYIYSVSLDKDDYKTQIGTFTIANADYYNTVELSPNTYIASFKVTPENAEFKLKSDEIELTPVNSEKGRYEYNLPNGCYTYSTAAFGFSEDAGSIEVNKSSIEKSIGLKRLPNVKTTFSLIDKISNTQLDNFRTEIKSANNTIASETDGSYLLPAGTYSYKAMCSGYAKCIGEFTITEADISMETKIITLETKPSSAWDGDCDEPAYSDGAWHISTGNELAWFAGYVNGTQTTSTENTSYNAILTADIDLGGELNWTPIGPNNYKAYSGAFDGNGHTISGLFINTDSACQGLFGKITVSSVIKNLTVAGSVNTASKSSYAYAGGICGYNYKGEIVNCINKANVKSSGGRTGGICGAIAGDGSKAAEISKCTNYGDISYENGTGNYKGGITGESKYANISECANIGNITGNGNFIGGIAGDLYSGSLLTDSYNTGTVTASGYSIGGVAGRCDLYGNYGMINCYSAGEVKNTLESPQNCGVLIGLYSGGLNKNCYCLIEDNGINSGLNAIGKIDFGTPSDVIVKNCADEMRGILEALNTNKVWTRNIKQNNGYPILKWQEIPDCLIKIDGEIVNSDSYVVNAGQHHIEIDFSLPAKNIENGLPALAAYSSNGALRKIWLADETYIISDDYDMPAGTVIKVMFWKNNLEPIINPVKIKTADENFKSNKI